ncbi:MAG: hypothetical protein WAN48_11795, partial [Actinomycetes bacterium]
RRHSWTSDLHRRAARSVDLWVKIPGVTRWKPDPATWALATRVFTDSPLPTLAAEAARRGHAIVEQVLGDLKNDPLAHFPPGPSGPTGAR